jgi:hypothetical protein
MALQDMALPAINISQKAPVQLMCSQHTSQKTSDTEKESIENKFIL